MNLTNKIDFAVIFRVQNANPNGDPLNGNRPRTTYESIGEVSDVCIKRKIRNRLMEKGVPIFVQSDDNKIDDYASLRARAEGAKLPFNNAKQLQEEACKKWFDVRAFGQLFALPGKKKGKKAEGRTENDAGEDKGVSIGIRGPVSVQSAFSIAPIGVTSTQITKSVSAEDPKEGKSRGSDTMGMKHRVDQGIYAFYGSMNPQLAVKTKFSNEDAAAIKSVLPCLFENDESSARPAGSMEILKVVWWQHNCPNGQVSSAKVHRSLKVSPQVDMTVGLSFDDIEGLAPEIIEGY